MINLHEEFSSKNVLRFPNNDSLTNCTIVGVLTVLGVPFSSPLRVLPIAVSKI